MLLNPVYSQPKICANSFATVIKEIVLLVYLCFGFCASLSQSNLNEKQDSCQTINNTEGECIEIHKCPSLFSLSKQHPPSLLDSYVLALSVCGDATESKVCCDKDEDDVEFRETTRSSANFRFFGSARSPVTAYSTPKCQKGRCVPTKDCPPLLNLLKTGPFTLKKRHYFMEMGCGFQGRDPMVCCFEETPEEPDAIVGPVTSDLLPDTETCGHMFADKIIGGRFVDYGEFPWMALLEFRNGGRSQFKCAGSLINNRYVLTAAHCINDTLASVRLGEHTISTTKDCAFCPDPVDIEITRKIVHENYIGNDVHDIALLRLAKVVNYTEFIKPICVPTTVELLTKIYESINMTVAGWGVTENATTSDSLLKVEIPVKNVAVCRGIYPNKLQHLPGVICAGGEKGKDSCVGDSGGPLMDRHQANIYIVGIVSFGKTDCGQRHWPGVYTHVAHYVPWIVSKLEP